jgi:hypothetical protein
VTAAAKAASKAGSDIAAVNRCATQNQPQHRVFKQTAKLQRKYDAWGTAEAAPLQSRFKPHQY